VCACSLRTQQGACKASAKVCAFPGLCGWGGLFYHPSDDSFG